MNFGSKNMLTIKYLHRFYGKIIDFPTSSSGARFFCVFKSIL